LARLSQPGEAVGVAEHALIAQHNKTIVAVTNRGSFAAGENVESDPLVRAALAVMPQTIDVEDTVRVRFLVSARPIEGSRWILLRSRPAALLLGDTLWKRILSLTALLGCIGLTGALALLAWRQNKSAQLAEFGAKEAQARQFLSTVSNSQPTGIYVVDGTDKLHFTNMTAEKWSVMDRTPLQSMIAAVRTGAHPQPMLMHHDDKQLHVHAHLLNPQFPQDDVLIVAEDLTELMAAHEQRQASQQALISTLAGLIDARDPGSKGHSLKVSHVAVAIGAALPLSGSDINCLRSAGELMNLGKILVPTALLTKTTALNDEERMQVRTAMAKTAELLAKVPFDGPVAETLADLEQDTPSTRLGAVLRLANNFIGQVSPRAHRAALPINLALENLRHAGFDAAMLSALSHWLDNKGGRESLI
jgi:hypothetical protein